jgi:hypothetical protein
MRLITGLAGHKTIRFHSSELVHFIKVFFKAFVDRYRIIARPAGITGNHTVLIFSTIISLGIDLKSAYWRQAGRRSEWGNEA